MLNPSFENGWTDINAGFSLINQQPNDWTITWLDVGEPLYASSSDVANGIPEIVHKLASQLPPNEQLGGPDALILDGTHVFKLFHAQASFGATLSQRVLNLEPDTRGNVVVPVNVHRHGATDPWGAEVGVFVNGSGQWFNSVLTDKEWDFLSVDFDVDGNGEAMVDIYFKSKWNSPKDFFVDDIRFTATPGSPPVDPPPGEQELTVDIPSWATKVVFKE